VCITVDSGDGYRLIAGGRAIGYKSVSPPEVEDENPVRRVPVSRY